jgi:hypothetical protein
MHKRVLIGLLALTAALAVVLVPGHGGASAAKSSDLVLPDLEQDLPRVLSVDPDGSGGWKLGFRSAVHNAGPGPMMVHGHRPDTSTPEMTADQLIVRADGSIATNPGIGKMQFVVAATHRHWHLLGFEVYELRRASDNKVVSPSTKTGFCLSDSSTDPNDMPPGKPDHAVNTSECGLNDPEALEVSEGISIGWNDVYDPFREGQDVSLNGVAAGQYMLVHRVNVDGRVRELGRFDDAATLLLQVGRPDGADGQPTVKTLRSCTAARQCYLKAPKIALAAVGRYARVGLHGVVKSVPASAHVKCARARSGGDCRVKFSGWRGTVQIRSLLVNGVPFYSWSARIKRHGHVRTGSGRVRVPGS